MKPFFTLLIAGMLILTGCQDNKQFKYRTKYDSTNIKPVEPPMRKEPTNVAALTLTNLAESDTTPPLDTRFYYTASWGYDKIEGCFNNPRGIAIAPDGDVYVIDIGGMRVQRFDADGEFQSQFYTGARANGIMSENAHSFTIDSDGKIYIPPMNGEPIVQVFDPNGNRITNLNCPVLPYEWDMGPFYNLDAFFIDSKDRLYGSDFNTRTIYVFSKAGKSIVNITDQGNIGYIYDLAVNPKTGRINALVDSATIVKLDGNYVPGQRIPLNPFPTDPARAKSMVYDAAGNAYIAYTEKNSIVKLNERDEVVLSWGTPGTNAGELSQPIDITVSKDNFVYVVDTGNNRIQKFTPFGKFVSQWGEPMRPDIHLRNPRDIAIDSKDTVYVADTGNDRIKLYKTDGTLITNWGSSGTNIGELRHPVYIAVDKDDCLYVSDSDNQRVLKYTAAGEVIANWKFDGNPSRIAIDSSNNVYVMGMTGGKTVKYSPRGDVIRTYDFSGSAICISDEGNIYVMTGGHVAMYNNGGIQIARMMDVSYDYCVDHSGGDLCMGKDGYVYAVDYHYQAVRVYTKNGKKISDDVNFQFENTRPFNPFAIDMDSRGNLYIADIYYNRILKMGRMN